MHTYFIKTKGLKVYIWITFYLYPLPITVDWWEECCSEHYQSVWCLIQKLCIGFTNILDTLHHCRKLSIHIMGKKKRGKSDWESITMLNHKIENQKSLAQTLHQWNRIVAQKYCQEPTFFNILKSYNSTT